MLASTVDLHLAIEIPRDALAAFCSKWDLPTLEFFGSVLREDFRPDSDVDVMITFDSIRQIPWAAIRRTRNILVHDYLNVDETIIWETIVIDLPILADAVRPLIHRED